MKLADIRQQWIVQETQRCFRTRKILTEARAPLTGAYYWYPKPADVDLSWDLLTFYDNEYDNTLHSDVWPEVLRKLAIDWNVDYRKLRLYAGNEYTALPRGRVSLGSDRQYNVLHGDDAPVNNANRWIINAFNLTQVHRIGKVKFVVDEHETSLPADVQRLRRLLPLGPALRQAR